MSQEKKRSGQLVVPGERLGVIEEFLPGKGTYVEQNTVYSNIIGRVLLDLMNKEVSMHPSVNNVKIPRTGNVVTGQAEEVQSKRAMLRIMFIEKRVLSSFFTGLLHISEVSPIYVENMFEACKAGDIIRARVISEKNRTFHLSTAEKELGVIYAFCSQCGQLLERKGRNMWCSKCEKMEKRKIASDYGAEKNV